jgi:hypothetical protein
MVIFLAALQNVPQDAPMTGMGMTLGGGFVVTLVMAYVLARFVVHYGEDCRAEFVRQAIERPPGWAGPQAPLVYSRSNCAID